MEKQRYFNYGTLSNINKMAVCRLCGKKTHSSNGGEVGIELCNKCFNELQKENEENDRK